MLVPQPQEEQVEAKQLHPKQRHQLPRPRPVVDRLMKEGRQQEKEDQDLLSQMDQTPIWKHKK